MKCILLNYNMRECWVEEWVGRGGRASSVWRLVEEVVGEEGQARKNYVEAGG